MNTDALTRIEADIKWLTEEIGPRPAFSSEARLATLGVRDRLVEYGWKPQFVHLSNNLVTCSGTGRIVLLAHTDTVTGSPGTLDNAVGVATLIELARQHSGKDLCLAFPAQEEIGLVGSTHLAEQIDAWHPDSSQVELVLSLDLVGHGTLSVTGLNRDWDHPSLHTLLDHTSIYSEYGYQVVSRLLPSMERSDHKPFADRGFRSAHLLGRNEHGITPNYHLETDTEYDIQSIIELESTLNTILETQWNESTDNSTLYGSATLGNTILPWWLLWSILLASSFVGMQRLWTKGIQFKGTLLAIPAGLLVGGISSLPAILHIFAPHDQEIATAQVFGASHADWLSPSGWWTGAWFLLPCVIALGAPNHVKKWLTGNATGWWGLCTLGLSVVDPILALPWAVGTLLSLLHPMLGMVGVAYWLQPDILRELSTHGLLPPMMWGLLGLLVFPALLANRDTEGR